MNKLIRISLSSIVLLVLSACSGGGGGGLQAGSLKLTVQTQTGVTTFSRAGEEITYNFVVTNETSSPLAGPAFVTVTATDGTKRVDCPDLETVGNADGNLDFNETVTCPSKYTISETDFNTGSVTVLGKARVGAMDSNEAGLTLTRAQSSVLKLGKTADPTSYNQIGQSIRYDYTITNLGPTPLAATQFVISDNKLTAPLNCGPPETVLAPNQPINCTANYLITQADMAAPNVTNTATATGAGQISAAVTTTITNSTIPLTPTVTPTIAAPPASGSTCPTSQQQKVPDSTCLHQVAKGEWLIQIGRCYGVSLNELISANPQVQDPSMILPSMLLTVRHLGSAGTIYGSPCITFVTVQSGDTWESLAQRFNARVDVLKLANPGGLVAGQQARIPLNSASGAGVTAAPGTATPTATGTQSTTVVQRISIPAGQTSVPLYGAVNPGQTVQYIITATTGQVLSVSLSGPANTEVNLGINGPTGLALQQPSGNFTWSTTVTTGGDHYINVTNLTGVVKTYTLTVGLTGAATPTFTPTATGVPTATPTPTVLLP